MNVDCLVTGTLLLAATMASASSGSPMPNDTPVWSPLAGAAASSGFIGLLLLWFVYTGRQDRQRERDEAATREKAAREDAVARERALAARLNTIEDEIRTSLVTRLGEFNQAMVAFERIARICADRATKTER